MKNKKTIFNIITSLVNQLVSIICGFIVPKLIINTFGSNVNGLVTSISQFLLYITLLESGFGPVIKASLYKSIANKDKNEIEKILKSSEKIFRKISYIFIVYIIVLCVFFPLRVNGEFDTFFTISLVLVISISTFTEYFFGMTYKLYLYSEQEHYVVNIIQTVTLILNAIIVVILIVCFNANIQMVKLATAIIFVLRPILSNIYAKKKYCLDIKNAERDYSIKNKWDGLAQHIAYVVRNNTDVVILTLCGNLAEVSVYSVYLMIVNGVKNLVSSFTGGVEAKFGVMIAKGEVENLRRSFKKFMIYYSTISTVIIIITLILIIPFVKIYVGDVKDAEYVRPVFAFLMVLISYIEIIRQPYSELIKSAGHFKETKIGALIEAILNIVISLILVWKYGIIGVAIGTMVAISIRMVELVYHSHKYILQKRK